MAGESKPGGGGGVVGGSGGGGGGSDAESMHAIWAYLNPHNFGKDGDYTGNAGSSADNIGPPGSEPPSLDRTGSPSQFGTRITPEGRHGMGTRQPGERTADPYGWAGAPPGPLTAFVGWDVDPYSGEAADRELPDPYSGLPQYRDPIEDLGAARLPPHRAAFTALRRATLLSSPYLLADNDGAPRLADRRSRMDAVSDFDPKASPEQMEADVVQSYKAISEYMEKKATFAIPGSVDFDNLIATAAKRANTPEHRLGYNVNMLRDHPVEVTRSPVTAGLGQMASGTFTLVGSGLPIAGSDGLLLPLVGSTGLASGIAQVGTGFTLAISGASSAQTISMTGQLDYAFALTSSPSGLTLGVAGAVMSNGDVSVSHNLALAGGLVVNMFLFRGDPSKLYSRVLPGVGTAAEAGATALRIKEVEALGTRLTGSPLQVAGNAADASTVSIRIGDVKALGFRTSAGDPEKYVEGITRNFTKEQRKALEPFRQTYVDTAGRADLAGNASHEAMKAAGPGEGVDFRKHGGAFIQDLKTHAGNTMIQSFYMDKASTQTLNYSLQYQLETYIKTGEQLVPIRSTLHMWVRPDDAVKLIRP